MTTLLRLALLATVVLAACAAPSLPVTLLTLPPRLETAAPAPLDPRRVLQIGRVAVPEYLSARSARYRADDSSLAAWPGTVWAERLEISLTRDLAAALRARLPGWQVCDDHCPAPPSHRLVVDLNVLEQVRSRGELQAQASWSWRPTARDGQAVTGQRSGLMRGLADTPQAGAVAMAAWVDSLATSIAAQLTP
jgi:uncharacterized lipoprotein YmbA